MSTFRPVKKSPWRDADAWHTLVVTALACLLTGGTLFMLYLGRAYGVARNATTVPATARCLLLFGKQLVNGVPDGDFQARIGRVHALLLQDPKRRVLLLGGGDGSALSEAAAAQQALIARGLPAQVELTLEDTSTDTLENLRNARSLLAAFAPQTVALVSSRYHLARCAALARNLGMSFEVCAAETHWQLDATTLKRLFLEAGYLCWLDVGTRWSRLIGNRRMLARVT